MQTIRAAEAAATRERQRRDEARLLQPRPSTGLTLRERALGEDGGADPLSWDELYALALYRILEAGILAGLLFSPLSDALGSRDIDPPPLATGITLFYLLFSLGMLIFGRDMAKRRDSSSWVTSS